MLIGQFSLGHHMIRYQRVWLEIWSGEGLLCLWL